MSELKNLRLIHLDLKTCPLKISYLHQLFKLFESWGGTGLLIEWEDTFPYDEELIDIGSSGRTAYTSNEIYEILGAAKHSNLTVIPLVQTFGHLEFVLKTSKWRHLREVPKYPSSMCPSHPDSYDLITAMITQIMKFHRDSEFIHLGSDEVWHLGLCERCKPQNRHQLFLKHVVKISKFVRQHYPEVTVIIWDDMLRVIDASSLQEYKINEFIEPMIWEYRRFDSFGLTTELWEKYEKIFDKIWIASAFKGATGSCQILPIIANHISNHEKWLDVMRKNTNKFKCIRGIVFTGWSRYDHYAALCELMPMGLPSLALCLKMWLKGKYDEEVYQEVSKSLGFSKEAPLLLYASNRPIQISKDVNFPSSNIYKGIEWFVNVRSRYEFVACGDQCTTWLNPWHVKHNNTSMMQIDHIVLNFKELLKELCSIEMYLRTHMLEAFYDNTIEEWLGCYVAPIKDKLSHLISCAEKQLSLEL